MKLTGDTWICDTADEIRGVLVDFPKCTVKGDTCYNFNDDLEEWLKGERQELEIVFDYIKCMHDHYFKRNVKDLDIALGIIEHPRWCGSCSYFSRKLMKDKEFCKRIVQSQGWDGSCEYFHQRTLMHDIDFIKCIIKSDRWDKSIQFFDRSVLFEEEIEDMLDDNIAYENFKDYELYHNTLCDF